MHAQAPAKVLPIGASVPLVPSLLVRFPVMKAPAYLVVRGPSSVRVGVIMRAEHWVGSQVLATAVSVLLYPWHHPPDVVTSNLSRVAFLAGLMELVAQAVPTSMWGTPLCLLVVSFTPRSGKHVLGIEDPSRPAPALDRVPAMGKQSKNACCFLKACGLRQTFQFTADMV